MSEKEDFHNIRGYVDRLMRSGDESAFLIITISGSEDFLQLTGDAKGVQLDFPMITDRQQSLESMIREIAWREGRTIEENQGDGGDRFLDISVEGTPTEVAANCERFLRDVFGAGEDAELIFEHDGLAV